MSALTLILQSLAYDDVGSTSNPRQVRINRRPNVQNIPVDNPATVPVPLAPGASATVIDGVRATTLDGTSAFSLALSSLDPTRYRITWTGGTNPTFRTDRGLTLQTVALTLTVNANLTLTVSAAGSPFSAVQNGDTVFIPGPSTGDAATLFNPLNEGFWYVLTHAAGTMTLSRAAGTVFSGATETVTPANNTQLVAFSAAGVQAGDTINLSAGFAASADHAYEVLAATATWVEFQSTAPLGPQTGVTPGAAGMVFYTSAKRFFALETDQEIVVQVNGDTGTSRHVVPWVQGDPNFVGLDMLVGPVWKLVLVNQSSVVANVLVVSAE